METAYALVEAGHEVTLGVRPDTQRPARNPFVFYGLAPTEGLQFVRAPVGGPHALRRFQYLAWALFRARRRRFDLVFTRDLGVASALLRIPRMRHPAIVYESHGFAPVFASSIDELVAGTRPATRAKLARLERREHFVWTKANGYVSTTQTLVNDLVDKWGTRDSVAVIANGVRLSRERTFPPPPPPGPPVAAYAGHLYPWKGVDVFLHAVAKVADVDALVVGGHPLEKDWARVRHAATELGIANRVTFPGFVAATEVERRLHRAAVVVVPTTATPSARYTSPLKLFEYMAAGRPIVATNLPAIREIIAHEVNGLLVAPDNPHEMAAAIEKLVRDPLLSDRLARRAFGDVEQYSWQRRGEKLTKLFKDVVR